MPRQRSRQPENELHGALLIDKPSGPTSHDIVDIIRGQYGLQKVGHCGTLDPAATGLLILLLGRATKLSMKLTADHKIYEGSIEFGKCTDSYDAQGDITATAAVPSLDCEALNTAAQSFREISSRNRPWFPPSRKTAYRSTNSPAKARPSNAKRSRFIFFIRIQSIHRTRRNLPGALLKGTYVRSLAHELGEQLGCGAHLRTLHRTASGKFDVADAIRLEDLVKLPESELPGRVISLVELAHLLQPA